MPDKKANQKKLQVIFAAIGMGLLFLVELYAMINLPSNFLVIGIVAVLMLTALYFVIAGVMGLKQLKEARAEERYDNIFKSEKASYLLLKKYFEDIEDKLIVLGEQAKVPTEEIVGAQKGIGKVIINRSRENAEAMLRSNEILTDQIAAFEDMLRQNNAGLMDSYRGVSEDLLQKIMLRQQELAMELKDMEIRIDNAIMQSSQKVVAAPMMAVPQMAAAPVEAAQVGVAPVVETAPVVEDVPVEEPVAEPVMEEAPVEAPVAEPVMEEAPVVEEVPVEEPVAEPVVEETPAEEPVPEPVVEEAPAAPELDLSDPNKMMSPDDIAALLAATAAEEPAAEPVVEEAPVEEPAAPELDLSDPNKMMSPDDIAALLASMDAPASEGDLAMEELAAGMMDDLALDDTAEVAEEAPAAPELDLSDPNKMMSPDDIAALLAAMDNK